MIIPLVIVVAAADNGVIGRDNRLIWRLKTDLRRFRDLTWGKPMIMGRKTYESIGSPLPGRETVVLTRNRGFAPPGVHVGHDWRETVDLAQALARDSGAAEIAVVGGADIFALALPEAQRIHLTLVHAAPEGNVLMPSFDRALFRELKREPHAQGPDDDHPFTFIDLERRPAAAPH
jgi:dihydrofolate reductase